MPRTPRKVSKSGIYHVTIRGVNRQLMFYDDADRMFLLNRMLRLKSETGFSLYAWCLMGNHIHLVIKEKEVSVSKIMQRLNASYTIYMNKKYDGSGTIYDGRFYSTPIETISYLRTVIRYTHQNPVRSSIVSTPSEYKWSSCQKYYDMPTNFSALTNIASILKLFSTHPEKSIQHFIQYTESVYELPWKNPSKLKELPDTQAVNLIQQHISHISIPQIKKLPCKQRNMIIRNLKQINCLNATQLSRILGIPKSVIWKA
ncbi:transposase [Jeotgalibacillus salarius]|uniref:Transposase n=1 Tax=Jeotgalibacillus salarius TaxID=546023 RepID=A0A4Y8LR71_9BACL|nr:transposase [Jeotgalibacillus salarius]TFE03959.1 transposase [Jeotgalibacillus salarius]